MLFTQLFEDDFNKKKTNESLADEFMAIAKAKGMNPRLRGTPDEERARTDAMMKQRAADRANAPAPEPVGDEERARLQARLKELEARFDPNYEYSDDHSFWTEQRGIAQQIGAIKQKLAQGVAEGLNEFAPAGGGGNIPRGPKTPRRGPWDDSGEDPYQLRRYNRSIDFFDQFDSDGVDKQNYDKATGEYEGYYFDRDAASGITQIAYFKFDDPTKIGDNDPGIGWYYEPVDEGVAEGSLNELAPGNSGDDDYDDNDDRSMEATFTIFSKGKAHTGTVIVFPGVITDVEYHLNGKIYIKNDMDNVYDYDDFITDAANYIQEIIQLEGDGHHFVEQQGVAEARAATARFRTGNKKRAELNAMSDEERRAYDKEQQEKQRRRDDARLERERQKLADKKKVAEGRMAELDAEYQDYKKLSPREFFNAYKITKQAWFEKHKGFLKNISEADKKKENEPETRDVTLQRAITKAKADFPTAGSGLEALAKDFMRSQDQDQKSFDQIRQAERQQNQMLNKINQIDQEQEQEIKDLEQQNSGLSKRLQQLQSVNSKLEKKLAAMSGRKTKSKDSSPDTIGTVGEPIAPKSSPTTVEPATPKVKTKNKAAPNAIKSTATQLAAPKADPMAAMATRIQRGDSSIINPKQAALPFEPSDNVLEPTIPQTQQNPKFAAARAGATDVDPKYYADIAKKVAGSPEKFKAAMGGVNENNKGSEKSERPEADYGDEYQAMVQRVGQKAAQGPRKTVWDPVKRVYKTVPVNK